jgi:uncharacterized SAM-binding protein YcdF (DUF218 family)
MQALKWALIILAGIALIIAGIIVGVGFFLSPQSKLEKADLIIAISGGETQQRTREAVRLYEQGYAPKLLFSGAAQDKSGPSNAEAMRLQAIDEGVPSSAILIEEASATTAQNAAQTAPMIRAIGANSIILVTSPYHQRRASINFRKILGRDTKIINHSATDSTWRKNSWWTHPYTVSLTVSELQKTLYEISTKAGASAQ